METIGEEVVLSALPPPHTPLAVIPSREDIIQNNTTGGANKGKKGGDKKDDGFTDFDKPFSQHGEEVAQNDEELD